MADHVDLNRRNFLTGRPAPPAVHISGAVVLAWPVRMAEVCARLGELPGTEVRHAENGKIVIVMEAASSGELGARLAEISGMDGVLAANMVFEQIDMSEDGGLA